MKRIKKYFSFILLIIRYINKVYKMKKAGEIQSSIIHNHEVPGSCPGLARFTIKQLHKKRM
jgi:hypothetical protein